MLEKLKSTNVLNPIGTKQTSYRYDANGNRVGQTVDGVETRYLIDANRPYAQVLEEYNGSASQANYVYGNSLISQNRSGVKSFYLEDGHSGVRKLTNSLGVVTDSYNYDAYGTLINSTGATSNNYLYRAEQFDVGLNQYYLRARYYNPSVGRLSSLDPFEGNLMSPMSRHRFMYGNSNPVTFQDPSGYFATSIEATTALSIINTLTTFLAYSSGVAIVQNALGNLLGRDLGWSGNLALGTGSLTYPPFTGTIGAGALVATSDLAKFSPLGGTLGYYVGSWFLFLGSISPSLPSIVPSSFGVDEVELASPRKIGANPLAFTGGALFISADLGSSAVTGFTIGFGVGQYTSASLGIDIGVSVLSGYSIAGPGNFIPSPNLPQTIRRPILRPNTSN